MLRCAHLIQTGKSVFFFPSPVFSAVKTNRAACSWNDFSLYTGFTGTVDNTGMANGHGDTNVSDNTWEDPASFTSQKVFDHEDA